MNYNRNGYSNKDMIKLLIGISIFFAGVLVLGFAGFKIISMSLNLMY